MIGRDARNLGHAHDVFDLVYADPPYRSGLHATTLDGLRQGGWIDGNSLCVTERAAEEEVASCAGFMLVDDRRYGAGCVSFYRLI